MRICYLYYCIFWYMSSNHMGYFYYAFFVCYFWTDHYKCHYMREDDMTDSEWITTEYFLDVLQNATTGWNSYSCVWVYSFYTALVLMSLLKLHNVTACQRDEYHNASKWVKQKESNTPHKNTYTHKHTCTLILLRQSLTMSCFQTLVETVAALFII